MKSAECADGGRQFGAQEDPISIRLHSGVLDRLRHDVLRARPQGIEVAGFLLGRTLYGLKPTLVIDGYAPVRPEHRDGKLFIYSGGAAAGLEEELRSMRTSSGVAGFYRSNVRSESVLRDEDLLLMADHFCGPRRAFLLIHGSGPRLLGTFFSPEGGDISRVRICLQVPLDGRDLRRRRSASAEEIDNAHGDASGDQSRMCSIPGPGAGWPVGGEGRSGSTFGAKCARTALISLAALGALTLGSLEYRTMRLLDEQRKSASQSTSVLDLKAERAGSQWRIIWNRAADPVRIATRGHLSILDGYIHREVDLPPADLQTGSISYAPFGDDVSFRLEVFDAEHGRAVSESIRVLASPWAVGGSPVVPQYGASRLDLTPRDSVSPSSASWRVDRHRKTGTRNGEFNAGSEGNAAGVGKQRDTAPAGLHEPVTVSREVNAGLPAPPRFAPGPAALDTAPPVLTSAGRLPVQTEDEAKALAKTATPVLPSPPAPKELAGTAVPAPDPVKHTGPVIPEPKPLVSTDGGGGSPGPATSSVFEEARLLKQSAPVYPQSAAVAHVYGVVQVQATIGKDGRIHNARAVTGPIALRPAAVAAVNGWVYRPRMLNGAAVDADTVVQVQFRPGTERQR